MEGITFLGKHSYRDFGLTLAPGRSIGDPDKKKILVPTAFSNVEYDFSEIYGDQVYTSRTLSYPFNVYIPGRTMKQAMTVKKTAVSNWLVNSGGKQPLYDDAMPGYYFMAEVEGGVSFDENYNDGILTVSFEAYPFRISVLPEGHDILDEIIFDLDVFQAVKFEINGQKEITLHNPGTPTVYPTIEASSAMQIQFNRRTYDIKAGTTPEADIPLASGENALIVTGNGTIQFEFHKELI